MRKYFSGGAGNKTFDTEISGITKALQGKLELLVIDLNSTLYKAPTTYDNKFRLYISSADMDISPPAPCVYFLLSKDYYVLFFKKLCLANPLIAKSFVFNDNTLIGTLYSFFAEIETNAKIYQSFDKYESKTFFEMPKPQVITKLSMGCVKVSGDKKEELYAQGYYLKSGYFYMYVIDHKNMNGYTKIKYGKMKEYMKYDFVNSQYLPINDQIVINELNAVNEWLIGDGYEFAPQVPILNEIAST